MNKKQLQRQITGALAASLLAMPMVFGTAPMPTANASGANIFGAIASGIAAHSQLNEVLHKYNDTEEGRQEFLQSMKKEYGVNDDWALNQQLERIMTNLTAGIGSVDPTVYNKPYNYFINSQDSFNAFCSLGHNLSVNTGLYKVLTNEDEIAVVLGHELGHGQKDHPAKGARQSLNMEILGAATGSQAGAVMAQVINNRNITKPMEREADALAFDYITHTNYNPGACAAVWQRVMDLQKSRPSAVNQFLSDHPADDSRRDTYVKKLTQYSDGHVTAQDGIIKVNTQVFATPAAAGGMSAKERSYFVMGNLSAAYHNGQSKNAATTDGNTVMLGSQPIMTCVAGDEDADTLAQRLNKIK